MSFQSPLMLLALALVPLGLFAYIAFERRREQDAAAFATADLLPSAAPVRARWRRHVPMALYAGALTVLVVALARPQATFAVDKEQASIVLATDVSGSMQATDVAPNRLEAARAAAKSFVGDVPKAIRVGVIAFNQQPRELAAPTTDRPLLGRALDRLRPSGSTATGDALTAALRTLQRTAARDGSERPPAAVVLLSDGASVRGSDPLAAAREAKRLGIPVFTVALGTDQGTIPSPDGSGTEAVPPDRVALRQIAEISGGEAFSAIDGEELSAVYERLGSQIAKEPEPQEITAGFAGGALALLALGGLLSVRWFGRLP